MKVKDTIIGFVVGDALGVPVEFLDRTALKKKPVRDMREYGSHNQAKGTWSDDSSLTFCLMEALIGGYNIEKIAENFINWYKSSYWTANNEVFDIGISTQKSIKNLIKGINPVKAGGDTEYENGNGSLMRVAPLVFYIKNMEISERFKIIKDISSITHRHERSVIACVFYIEFLINLIDGMEKIEAFEKSVDITKLSFKGSLELRHFERIFSKEIINEDEKNIKSTGYVIHSLEASIWCFFNSESYKEAVLKAVNLGEDTDTVGAITASIAGLYYGYSSIPKEWIEVLQRKEDIFDLINRFEKSLKEN